MTTKLKETTKIFTSIFPVWSLWYIGILLVVYIISNIFSDDGIASFFGFGMTANSTYLLVLAIITILMFIEWALNMGVSRKTFYKSMLLTGIVTAVFITAVVGLISFGLSFTPFDGEYLTEELVHLSSLEYIIFEIFSGILYYTMGMLLGLAFYKGFWQGILAVLGSMLGVMLITFNGDLLNYFGAIGDMTVYIGFLLLIVLTLIYSWIGYKVVKNMPIKFG